jgi:hypothetical protein
MVLLLLKELMIMREVEDGIRDVVIDFTGLSSDEFSDCQRKSS